MNKKIHMNILLKIAIGLFAGLSLLTACDDSDDELVTGLTLGAKEFTLGAEGGTERVSVTAGGKWVVKVDQPWVKVMPANGVGSVECEVVVDTTLSNQVRHAVVTFIHEGQSGEQLEVHQTGYGKMIGLSEKEMEIENMGEYDHRYFDISVTTNVPFKVDIPQEAKAWLHLEKNNTTPSVNLDFGARPRTTKVRFEWDMNTDPQTREALVAFVPLNAGDTLEQEAALLVKQEAAPEINDDRAGDSTALIIIAAKFRCGSWNTSEKLDYWAGVTLWEKTDEGVTTEMIGRVRSAEFRLLNTKEGLPVELAKLRYLETLTVSGNTNTSLLPDNFSMGTALAGLKHLKNLTVETYGLTSVNPATELKEPRLVLEYLDLGSNNFNTLPSTLTKNNFPKLKALHLRANRRYGSLTDMKNGWRDNAGMKIDASGYAFKTLLKWENLEELYLSYNYIYGQLPDMKSEWDVKPYTDEQIATNDTLNSAADKGFLKTVPRVLPNVKHFAINLNFLTGELPDWLLYHPRLALFDPFTLVFTQENGYDPDGKVPAFTNVPASLDYFYTFYPAAKPTKNE